MVGFDWTITVGNIVEISTLVAGGIATIVIMRQTIGDMQKEIEKMEAKMEDFGKTIIQLAVQQERLDRIEEDIRDMRKGRGFITEEGQSLPFMHRQK